MTPKTKTKASSRLLRAKTERGEIVAARVKEIAASKKSRGSRGRGLTREDLEALRDGKA